MRFTEDDLREFIAIYEEEFGEKLPKDEAEAMAHRLMVLMESLEDGA